MDNTPSHNVNLQYLINFLWGVRTFGLIYMTLHLIDTLYIKIMTSLPHDPLYLTHFHITWSYWTHFFNKIHQKPPCTSTMVKLGPKCPVWRLSQLEIEEAMVLTRILPRVIGWSIWWPSCMSSSAKTLVSLG